MLRLRYLLAADRVQQHCISLSATIFLTPCPIRAGRAFQTLPAACHTLVTTCACRHMATMPRATLAADRVQQRGRCMSATCNVRVQQRGRCMSATCLLAEATTIRVSTAPRIFRPWFGRSIHEVVMGTCRGAI